MPAWPACPRWPARRTTSSCAGPVPTCAMPAWSSANATTTQQPPIGTLAGAGAAAVPVVEARRGDAHRSAAPPDPVLLAVLVDEPVAGHQVVSFAKHRRLDQQLPLHPQLGDLTAQPPQLLALTGGEPLGFALVDAVLLDPLAQRLAVAAELPGDLGDGLVAGAHQRHRITANSSDLGLVAATLAAGGLAEVERMQVQAGNPVWLVAPGRWWPGTAVVGLAGLEPAT
jgi:hypothetical protein